MEMQMPMSEVMAVMVTGLVVVFVGLILLIAVISIVGKIFEAIDSSKKKEIAEPTTVKNTGEINLASADENEVIAAIAAAVAMMGVADNTTYKIKSIKAANNACMSRSAWAMAGLNESTSPF